MLPSVIFVLTDEDCSIISAHDKKCSIIHDDKSEFLTRTCALRPCLCFGLMVFSNFCHGILYVGMLLDGRSLVCHMPISNPDVPEDTESLKNCHGGKIHSLQFPKCGYTV
jgi:hypothetical protein